MKSRNELMHSCEMKVSSQWLCQYERKIEDLLLELKHIPEVAAAGRDISEVMSYNTWYNGFHSIPKDIGQSSETLRYKTWFKAQLDVQTQQRSKAHIKIYFRMVKEE
ncbi:UNVERIFIED_CONTAM: hypothetical protein FKN15_064279 [Acipenser sinensis]